MIINLNGNWKMRNISQNDYLEAKVPGSVYNDLLNAGKMEDPFYRDNEDIALKLCDYDYEYIRTFTVDKSLLQCDKVLLVCKGIDTLSTIILNGNTIAKTDNMHRTYEFDIKSCLIEGENNIKVILHSPTRFMERKHKEDPLWGANDCIQGFPHLRKAHCMSGWDWGPKLPDMGIWRDIYILGQNHGRLTDVYITQHHNNGEVNLEVKVSYESYKACCSNVDNFDIEVIVTYPNGEKKSYECNDALQTTYMSIDIEKPELWWPNGYGSQPLYNIYVKLKYKGEIVDTSNFNIGLRTLTVRKEKDEWGESFEINVNGISIFAMGADYIPEDNILARCNKERTERLIKNCIKANFNMLRVWGGGYYPDDYFFDLCDKYGIIVWQDLMYACAVYRMTEEFTQNIIQETIDNVKRIRHHASLGLWCGNNEMEWGWVTWPFPKTADLKTDYIKQFEIILPETVKKHDPNTFYWKSSPSSGGGFDNPNDENRGDVHYWDVWHGLKPFTDYRNYYFRFVSEFGFQSFPNLKTIKTFTLPEDRNIFSYVMEKHQKNGSANGKILYYLSQNFKYPKDFDSLLYTSQILQAEAIKYGVEHWRRNRGRCMGAIYWQLNDCWPVASWASIDYYGRWKALHYFAKRFFSPILASALDHDKRIDLYVTNDTLLSFTGTLSWSLRTQDSNIIESSEKEIEISPLTAKCFVNLDFSKYLQTNQDKRKLYFEYTLKDNGKVISSGTILFTETKHYEFLNPNLNVDVIEGENSFEFVVKAENFAKYVEIDLANYDCVFDDNYFDLIGGERKIVSVDKAELPQDITVNELKKQIKIRSIFDIA